MASRRCAPRVRVWRNCASSASHCRSNASTRATIRFCSAKGGPEPNPLPTAGTFERSFIHLDFRQGFGVFEFVRCEKLLFLGFDLLQQFRHRLVSRVSFNKQAPHCEFQSQLAHLGDRVRLVGQQVEVLVERGAGHGRKAKG